jgi:hypothetical protein
VDSGVKKEQTGYESGPSNLYVPPGRGEHKSLIYSKICVVNKVFKTAWENVYNKHL